MDFQKFSPQQMLASMHDLLRAHRKLLYGVFGYYAALDGKLHKVTTFGFFAMAADCGILSEKVTSAHLTEVGHA